MFRTNAGRRFSAIAAAIAAAAALSLASGCSSTDAAPSADEIVDAAVTAYTESGAQVDNDALDALIADFADELLSERTASGDAATAGSAAPTAQAAPAAAKQTGKNEIAAKNEKKEEKKDSKQDKKDKKDKQNKDTGSEQNTPSAQPDQSEQPTRPAQSDAVSGVLPNASDFYGFTTLRETTVYADFAEGDRGVDPIGTVPAGNYYVSPANIRFDGFSSHAEGADGTMWYYVPAAGGWMSGSDLQNAGRWATPEVCERLRGDIDTFIAGCGFSSEDDHWDDPYPISFRYLSTRGYESYDKYLADVMTVVKYYQNSGCTHIRWACMNAPDGELVCELSFNIYHRDESTAGVPSDIFPNVSDPYFFMTVKDTPVYSDFLEGDRGIHPDVVVPAGRSYVSPANIRFDGFSSHAEGADGTMWYYVPDIGWFDSRDLVSPESWMTPDVRERIIREVDTFIADCGFSSVDDHRDDPYPIGIRCLSTAGYASAEDYLDAVKSAIRLHKDSGCTHIRWNYTVSPNGELVYELSFNIYDGADEEPAADLPATTCTGVWGTVDEMTADLYAYAAETYGLRRWDGLCEDETAPHMHFVSNPASYDYREDILNVLYSYAQPGTQTELIEVLFSDDGNTCDIYVG